MAQKMAQNITFKRRKRYPKKAIAIAAVAVTLLVVTVSIIVIASLKKEKDYTEEIGKGEWVAGGFDSISDIKCLDEKYLVFTDKSSGLKGLMSLDGTITQEAEYSEYVICSTEWNSILYVAKGGAAEYPLRVAESSGKVSNRQFNDPEQPEFIPCWDASSESLILTAADGRTDGTAEKKKLNLAEGYYAVSTSRGEDAKWGFVDHNLTLKISVTYDAAGNFSEGLAAVKNKGKWGYVDADEVIKIKTIYESAAEANAVGKDCSFSFRNGLAPVKLNGKYGIINSKGETVVNFSFDRILQGKNGKYVACKDGQWGTITVPKENFIKPQDSLANPEEKQSVGAGTYTVKTSGVPLNFRREASADSSLLGKIPNGSVVKVLRSQAGWAYIEYKSQEGWVSSDYLVPGGTAATQPPKTTQNN